MPKLFDEDSTPTINLFWLIVVIIIVICIIYYILIRYYFLPGHGIEAWGQRGTVGDTFGVINALFTGAGFAGAIFVILLQRTDLRRQRKENKEAEDKQKTRDESQQNNFNLQLKQIEAQTQAITNQLGQYQKQTEAVLEQVDQTKEQTNAINQQVKEVEKQTENLLEQIKLSIMPAFVVEMKRGGMATPDSTDSRSFSEIAYIFEITNIGNGTGKNIRIENISIKTERYDPAFIRFRLISFVKKGETKNIRNTAIGLKKELGDRESNLKGYDTNLEGNVKSISYVYDTYNENNLLPIKLTFEDIKGTKYKQEIKIGANISIPGKVEEDK